MAQEFDLKGLQKQRRAKKFKKLMKKLIVVMIFLCVGAVVYITKDNWLPFFNGIATRYIPTSSNTGELAQGQFPVKIEGGADYQTTALENCFAIIDDTHFYIYGTDGALTLEKQHDYANPVMKSNRKKSLIYDLGGSKFSLESKYKTVYSKELEEKILFARISHADYCAVITTSDKSSSSMSIYDPSGTLIYTWKCTEGRIIDVVFTSTNDGCFVTTFDSKNGQMISKVNKFLFNSTTKIWETQSTDTMPISSQILNDGTIVVVGDTKCAYYSKDGSFIGSYAYPYDLVDYDLSPDGTALLLRNEEIRVSLAVNINSMDDIVLTTIDENAKSINFDGENIFILTDSEILVYTKDGTKLPGVNVNFEYHDFFKINTYIYLLGDSEIDRIDFQ